MVELVITGSVIAAAAYVVTKRPTSVVPVAGGAEAGDLPCPWCRASTAETDLECPGCGQVFG